MNHAAFPKLILGSTSRYRHELLKRLGLPFEACAPQVDETPRPGETPSQLAWRLALEKAHAVARSFPGQDVLVIGSDQVADLHGQAIGKPGTHERAVEQLQAMRGQTVIFHTAVAVVRPARAFAEAETSTIRVRMGSYSDDALQSYLELERPYDCAGSAKSEGIGVVLLDEIESTDPTALIGLPLISTTRLMRQAGIDLLRWRTTLTNTTP